MQPVHYALIARSPSADVALHLTLLYLRGAYPSPVVRSPCNFKLRRFVACACGVMRLLANYFSLI